MKPVLTPKAGCRLLPAPRRYCSELAGYLASSNDTHTTCTRLAPRKNMSGKLTVLPDGVAVTITSLVVDVNGIPVMTAAPLAGHRAIASFIMGAHNYD